MKKIMCLVISLLIFIGSTSSIGTAFNNDIVAINIGTISKSLNLMEKSFKVFNIGDLVNDSILNHYDVILIYELLHNNYENIYIIENNIRNKITITSEGYVYIDDSPVIVQNLDSEGKIINEEVFKNKEISFYAQTKTFFSSPPKGTVASDYNTYVETISKRVTFGTNLIKNLTETAFCTVLGGAIGGISGAVASGILASVYNAAIDTIPNNNALSTIQNRYKKMYVAGFLMVTKDITDYYIFDNFTGKFDTTIHYVGYDS